MVLPTLQQLPPSQAHFCLGVERFIRTDLGVAPDNASFLVALSGGADSTALLCILSLLAPRLGCTLHAAHLDHGIRTDAAADAEAAAQLCAALSIPFYSERVDAPTHAAATGRGLEDAGRELRYDFLERTRANIEANWITTGHTLNDLAEDQLMRRIRGAGWPALGGMEGVDANRRLLRPLLGTVKDDITALLHSVGVSWREDPSNADQRFLRNRVRARLTPLFAAENPGYLDNALTLWRQARADAAYWDALAAERLDQRADGFFVSSETMNGPQAIATRLLKAGLDRLGPGQALRSNIENLLQAWRSSGVGAAVQFPGGKRALVQKEGVLLCRP